MSARSAALEQPPPAAGPAAGRGAGELLHALGPHPLAARLRTGADLARARREAPAPERRPTGLPALDRLLAGGLVPGELVEWVGRRSSGRWAALLALLAATTARGEGAVLVDAGDALEPRDAAAAGVDLARLLWARSATPREALAAAEIALAGGWPLVALDLGDGPLPGRTADEAAWQRLARAAEASGAALVVSSPRRVTGSAAAAVLRGERGGVRWLGPGTAPPLLGGLCGELALERGRPGERGREGARERLLLGVPEALPAPAGEGTEGARRVVAAAEGAAAEGAEGAEGAAEGARRVVGRVVGTARAVAS